MLMSIELFVFCYGVFVSLHVFELIYATFGVALADFPKGFVFVAALAHVFSMDFVHGSFLGFVT